MTGAEKLLETARAEIGITVRKADLSPAVHS